MDKQPSSYYKWIYNPTDGLTLWATEGADGPPDHDHIGKGQIKGWAEVTPHGQTDRGKGEVANITYEGDEALAHDVLEKVKTELQQAHPEIEVYNDSTGDRRLSGWVRDQWGNQRWEPNPFPVRHEGMLPGEWNAAFEDWTMQPTADKQKALDAVKDQLTAPDYEAGVRAIEMDQLRDTDPKAWYQKYYIEPYQRFIDEVKQLREYLLKQGYPLDAVEPLAKKYLSERYGDILDHRLIDEVLAPAATDDIREPLNAYLNNLYYPDPSHSQHTPGAKPIHGEGPTSDYWGSDSEHWVNLNPGPGELFDWFNKLVPRGEQGPPPEYRPNDPRWSSYYEPQYPWIADTDGNAYLGGPGETHDHVAERHNIPKWRRQHEGVVFKGEVVHSTPMPPQAVLQAVEGQWAKDHKKDHETRKERGQFSSSRTAADLQQLAQYAVSIAVTLAGTGIKLWNLKAIQHNDNLWARVAWQLEEMGYSPSEAQAAAQMARGMDELSAVIRRAQPPGINDVIQNYGQEPEQGWLPRTSAMSRTRRLDMATRLPHDKSEIVHDFGNGWTIRQLQTNGDRHREGHLMSNCWRFEPDQIPVDSLYDFMQQPIGPWYEGQMDESVTNTDPDSAKWMSLRDPDNLPHVSFYQGHPWNPNEVTQMLGTHNSHPKDEYIEMLRQYAQHHGLDFPGFIATSAWVPDRRAGVPSQWDSFEEDRDKCPYCGAKMRSRDYCKACKRVVSEYRGQHQAPGPESGSSFDDPSYSMPDVHEHPEYYTYYGVDLSDVVEHLRKARGNPDYMVPIYRAGPTNQINTGDWVTPSLAYAQQHAAVSENPEDDMPITQAMARAGDLWNYGDLPEWGYHGPSTQGQHLAKLSDERTAAGNMPSATSVEDGWTTTDMHTHSFPEMKLAPMPVTESPRQIGFDTSKTYWAYLNGEVAFAPTLHGAVQRATMGKLDKATVNRMTNMMAAGAYPTGMPFNIAAGVLHKGKPRILATNVDRNAVYDAVFQKVNERKGAWGDDLRPTAQCGWCDDDATWQRNCHFTTSDGVYTASPFYACDHHRDSLVSEMTGIYGYEGGEPQPYGKNDQMTFEAAAVYLCDWCDNPPEYKLGTSSTNEYGRQYTHYSYACRDHRSYLEGEHRTLGRPPGASTGIQFYTPPDPQRRLFEGKLSDDLFEFPKRLRAWAKDNLPD